MSVRVAFEIGHEASIRTKRTPEGFTHDWEVFVRGVESADISHFIDKVVFLLHETFQKPKRVLKEPPYSVKESGYAGFILPIEIYLKNRDEPKKIKFTYDLCLQQAGPATINVRKERYVFNAPNDDFKKKLIKGGGIVVNPGTSLMYQSNMEQERNSRDSFTDEKPQLIGKPKLSGESSKKHRSKEHRIEDIARPSSFENLFGPPIQKTSKVSPDPKKQSIPVKTEKKDKGPAEKDKQKIKHEHKEKLEKIKIKEDKDRVKEEKVKTHNKDEDRSKEKSSKRPSERPLSPSTVPQIKKHCPSPNLKRGISPSSKSNGSISNGPVIKEEPKINSKSMDGFDFKKSVKSEERTSGEIKSEKKSKKEKKSHNKDKERTPKKEHKKDHKPPSLHKEIQKEPPKPKECKERESVSKEISIKEKPVKPINKFSIENMLKDPQEVVVKHNDNIKHKEKGDSERKHKHKKKDKKRDESREKHKESSKDRRHKHDKHVKEPVPPPPAKELPVYIEKQEIVPAKEKDRIKEIQKENDRTQDTMSPISIDTSSQSSSKSSKISKTINPLEAMIENITSSSNSDSDVSLLSEDEASNLTENVPKSKAKSLPKADTLKVENCKPIIPELASKPVTPVSEKPEKPTPGSSHKDKPKKHKEKSSKHDREEKKSKKRKSSSKTDESNIKTPKVTDGLPSKKSDSSTSSEAGQSLKTETKVQDNGVSSSLGEEGPACDTPESDNSQDTSQDLTPDNREMTPDPSDLSPDYMMQLRELQQRIMTIKSNDELERVVNLIAETGRYEVTTQTFDFDLCLLDRSTVQRLIELIGC